jgi:hypothetical protein
MSKALRRLALCAGLIAAGYWAWRSAWPRPAEPLQVRVARAPFAETIRVRGHIEPQRFTDLQAPTAAAERQVIQLAPEGAFVRAGEVVAEFDPGPLLLQIEELRNRLREMEMSKEDVETLMDSKVYEERVGVGTRRQNLALAEIKAQALSHESGLRQAGGKLQLNMARQDVETAKGRLGRVGRQKEARVEDQVEKAARLLEKIGETEVQIEQFTLEAPADSIVVYPPIPITGEFRKVEQGDYLQRGQAFARLPDLSSLVVRVYLVEDEVERIRQGMKVSVVPVADRSLRLAGEVASVSKIATFLPGKGKRQFFEAAIRFDPAGREEFLKVGMVVDVAVGVKDHGEVYAVPRDFATPEGDGWAVDLRAADGTISRAPLGGATECGDFLLVAALPGAAGAEEATLVFDPKRK